MSRPRRAAQVEIRKKEAIEEEKVKIVKDIERGIKAQEEVQERIRYAASIRAERRQKIIDHRKEKEKYYGVVCSRRPDATRGHRTSTRVVSLSNLSEFERRSGRSGWRRSRAKSSRMSWMK